MTTGNRVSAKEHLRGLLRARIAAMDESAIVSESLAMQERIVSAEAFSLARTVCCYVAIEREVSTDMLITQCHESGKTLVLPVFEPAKGVYDLAIQGSDTPMTAGHFGIPEPAGATGRFEGTADIVIVPGLGFDRTGHRVGRGGGFYDRLLVDPRLSGALRIGVAFSVQILDAIEVTEEHDESMDVVAANGEMWRCVSEKK